MTTKQGRPVTRRGYIAAAIPLLAGCQTTATETTTTPNATTTTTSDPDGWVLRLGSDAPHDWADPTTITFEYYDGDDWQTETTLHVDIGERFFPALDEGVRYRIHVASANGRERMLGSYKHIGRTDVELILFGCCSDSGGAR